MARSSKPRFVRFVSGELHRHSRRPVGVLHAIRYLRDDGNLTRKELRTADAVFDWLYNCLEAPPSRLLRKHPQAVSWFLIGATAHIRQIERLVRILESKGIAVRRLYRVRPGRIVFRDEHQVFALPVHRVRKERRKQNARR